MRLLGAEKLVASGEVPGAGRRPFVRRAEDVDGDRRSTRAAVLQDISLSSPYPVARPSS